jgi:hypothetical protein
MAASVADLSLGFRDDIHASASTTTAVEVLDMERGLRLLREFAYLWGTLVLVLVLAIAKVALSAALASSEILNRGLHCRLRSIGTGGLRRGRPGWYLRGEGGWWNSPPHRDVYLTQALCNLPIRFRFLPCSLYLCSRDALLDLSQLFLASQFQVFLGHYRQLGTLGHREQRKSHLVL